MTPLFSNTSRLTSIVVPLCLILAVSCKPPRIEDYHGDEHIVTGDDATSEAIVLALIDDVPFTLADFQRRVEALDEPARSRLESASHRDTFAHAIVQLELLAREAQQAGYGPDPAVQQAVRMATADAVAERLAGERLRGQRIMRTAVRERYDADITDYVRAEEFWLRIAVLPEHDAARQIYDRIGAQLRLHPIEWAVDQFDAVAREHSIDPSSSRGGDVGYLGREDVEALLGTELAQELSAAENAGELFGPTPMGNHWAVVLLVKQQRAFSTPFEAVEASLRATMLREAIDEQRELVLADLKADLHITVDDDLIDALEAARPQSVGHSASPDEEVLERLLHPRYDLTSLHDLARPPAHEGTGSGSDQGVQQ